VSVLSDKDIKWQMRKGTIGIEPFDASRVQPASYDVSLSSKFRVFSGTAKKIIVPGELDPDLMRTEDLTASDKKYLVLGPNQFVLGMTCEHVRIPPFVCARIEGKSSLGRIGLVIHSTAGWIDPGFEGKITLEISNDAPLPIRLVPGMLIGQIAFMYMSSVVERPYGHPDLGSKYQGHTEPTESRYTS
jgi:dCTP deaminase